VSLVVVADLGRLSRIRCDCGGTRVVLTTDVRRGHVTSCGCGRRRVGEAKAKPIPPGAEFGRLTVLQRAGSTRRKQEALFLCRCVCGWTGRIRGQALRSGNSTSCGCTRWGRS